MLPGGLVTVRAFSRYGTSVNGIAGPLLAVNTIGFVPITKNLDDSIPLTVVNVTYTQFLSSQFAITLGKLETLSGDANEFASGRGESQFLNMNLVFSPVLAMDVPYNTLGGGVSWVPDPHVKVSSLVVATNDSSTTSGFETLGNGWTWTTEADFQYRLGNLPGGTNIGAAYAWDNNFSLVHGQFVFVPGIGLAKITKSDTWGFYHSNWQYQFVKGLTKPLTDVGSGEPNYQGVGVFARLGVADQDTNPFKFGASVGVGGKGMVPEVSPHLSNEQRAP